MISTALSIIWGVVSRPRDILTDLEAVRSSRPEANGGRIFANFCKIFDFFEDFLKILLQKPP